MIYQDEFLKTITSQDVPEEPVEPTEEAVSTEAPAEPAVAPEEEEEVGPTE